MMIKNFVGIKTFYGMNTIELGGGGPPPLATVRTAK